MTTKINKIIVTFALVICTVLGLANPVTVNAKAKVKNIKKTTTITLTKEHQKIDLRKALGKFKNYVTTDESLVKITKKPYDQELYYKKSGIYVIQLAGRKVNKNFKLKAKKGNQKLTLTVKIKNKIKFDDGDPKGTIFNPYTKEEYLAILMEDEWYVKCINDIKAIIATEDTMNDYLIRKTKKHFRKDLNIPFKTKQVLCAEHWLAKRMHYYFDENGNPCHKRDYASFKHLYNGTFKGVCAVGAEYTYRIFLSLDIGKPMIASSFSMNHGWCMVKIENTKNEWMAYGITTPSSFGRTCSWDTFANNPTWTESNIGIPEGWDDGRLVGGDYYGYIGPDGKKRKWNAGRWLDIYTEKAKKIETPTVTPTPIPTATATPTSEPESPMENDETYYDEDEEEAA